MNVFRLSRPAGLALLTAVSAWLFMAASCNSSRQIGKDPSDGNKGEPVWAPKDYGYKPSVTRRHDLLHTYLEVKPDWKTRRLAGYARLRMTPYFYATDSLILDAKGFDIQEVNLVSGGIVQPLTYTYDSLKLRIHLGQTFTRKDTFEVGIRYTAKPYERTVGGSAAITEDRGLYFINADGADSSVPKQIWTQGETEASSCWFPTFDQTNERCTDEIRITVDTQYVTISNGLCTSKKLNGDGTRTDTWVMSKPHAPYLFAMAIGEFSETKETWRGKEVTYYMEKEYGPYAKAVFGHTPEMLEFYSTKLGVPFPWDKYAQIVVREFVSGAMENTTCTIHYDQLNQDANENYDESRDDIICHELFHQWFGDYVTCESWANLALNESFATYGEYLWFEHKFGRDAAEYHRFNDISLYRSEARTQREPIIRFGYSDPGSMFDRHSYQKGGLVLHMLRTYVGDDAFFTALNKYLTRNAFTDVEMHELRLAFEDVTGEDLNWFFDQWFYKPGHPELKIAYTFTDGAVKINVKQTQDFRYVPVFKMPLRVQLTDRKGESSYFPITISSKDTTFSFSMKGVANAVLDADGALLAFVEESGKTEGNWILQSHAPYTWANRMAAFEHLADADLNEAIAGAAIEGLKDPSEDIRKMALDMLGQYRGPRRTAVLKEGIRLAGEDPRPAVRKQALETFANDSVLLFVGTNGMGPSLLKAINSGLRDSSYQVQSISLALLTYTDPKRAIEMADSLSVTRSASLKYIATAILMSKRNISYLPAILNNVKTIKESQEKFQLIQDLGGYLQTIPEESRKDGILLLIDLCAKGGQWWLRYAAADALSAFRDFPGVKEMAATRLKEETSEEVRQMLKGLQ